MYRIVWSAGPWGDYTEDFPDCESMMDRYNELCNDPKVTYVCKYELVALGEFTR